MSAHVVLALLVALAAVSEQRVLVVEVPAAERPLALTEAEQALDSEVGGRAATAQLTVPSVDVEALTRFLRFHYRRYLMRLFPLQQADGGSAVGDNQCDPDECYSHCYLQGFRSGKCKENKCFCTQSPTPAPGTTTPAPAPPRGLP